MSNLKEYLESRTNNPFWWAFLVSFVLINWELVIYSIYEFKSMNFTFFAANLKDGFWLLVPIGAGFINAILGQSFTEFLSALSLKVHNESKLWYIKLSNDTTVAKSSHDKVKAELASTKSSHDKVKAELENAKSSQGRVKAELESAKSSHDNVKAEIENVRSSQEKVEAGLESAILLKVKALEDLARETNLLENSKKDLSDLKHTVFESHNVLDKKLKAIRARCFALESSMDNNNGLRNQVKLIAEDVQLLLYDLPITVEEA